MELSDLSVKDLLQLEVAIIGELRRRNLVRTNNKPLGDIAEQIVWSSRGGVLEPNSTKSHDVTDAEGKRVQVKAVSVRANARSGRFSAFRSFFFDTAVFLVFDSETVELLSAREVVAKDVESVSPYSSHTNGWQPTLGQIERLGIDITDEMKWAYDTLC